LTAGIADAEIADHPFNRREVFVVDKGGATIPAEAEVELWARFSAAWMALTQKDC
jgi:hypothetical protein